MDPKAFIEYSIIRKMSTKVLKSTVEERKVLIKFDDMNADVTSKNFTQ